MDHKLRLDPEVDPIEIAKCIEACEHSHRVCLRTAMRQTLDGGGGRVESPNFRLIHGCANVCHLTADALRAGLPLYQYVCAVCARVCRDCALGCRHFDDMYECIEACLQCAERCDAVARAFDGSTPALAANN